MALRIKETAFVILLAAGTLAAADLRFDVRHEHFRQGCAGVLRIDERGVGFQATPSKKRHAWRWEFSDIQQLKLESGRLTVLTYEDRKWRFGADRAFTFTAAAGASFESAYAPLKRRLDQRFVAALADAHVEALWSIPAKRLARVKGAHGTLIVSADRISFTSAEPGAARIWRYGDIDSIGSSGPFELTMTTYERASTDYGSRRSFRFQLKQPLAEDRYDDLWRRVNQSRIRRIQ